MNREQLSEIIGNIDDRQIAEAIRYAPEEASASPERIGHMKKKRIITFVLAAALMLALGIAAYATNAAVGTPQAAERVAKEQIAIWKDMGLLSPEVEFEGSADAIVEIPERTGNESWYGRFFSHSYDVRWYAGYAGTGAKYGCNLQVDTLTGKIMMAAIDAMAEEDDVLVRTEDIRQPADPRNPEGEQVTETLYFYNNFDDIFSPDMTVDRFCSLLAEYWGFSGYTLADTDAEAFYGTHWDAIDGSTLLKDLSSDTRENYYLTVFFDGDQSGAPMYLQLFQFPGYVTLMLGTAHAVG